MSTERNRADSIGGMFDKDALRALPRRGHTVSSNGQRVLHDVIIHDLTSYAGTAFAVVEQEDGQIKTYPAASVRFGPKPEGAAK